MLVAVIIEILAIITRLAHFCGHRTLLHFDPDFIHNR